MLPANVGTVNPSQGKRDVEIIVSPVKAGKNSLHMAKAMARSPEEVRYVPIAPKPAKPCNITISNHNDNNHNTLIHNNNISKNINNATAIKPKLTPINVVQKQLKTNNNLTMPAPPLIQLVPTNTANGNANSLLSILTSKTLLNPTCTKSNVQTLAQSQIQLNQPQAQDQEQTQTQGQAVLIRPTSTMVSVPAQHQPQQQQVKNISPGISAVSTQTQFINVMAAKVPLKAAAAPPANGQISMVSKPRTPVILSKAAVEKIRLKFGQVQAQANSGGALILTKSLKANSANGKSPTTKSSNNNIDSRSNNNNDSNTSNNINNSSNNNDEKNNSNTNSGATKTVEEGDSQTVVKKPSDTTVSSMPTPMPTPMPMPMLLPAPMPMPMPLAIKCNALPEIKISPLPAVALTATKMLKARKSPLAVVLSETPNKATAVPATITPEATTTTETTTVSGAIITTKPNEQIGSPKLQRSKSLAGNENNASVILIQTNTTERRHSVAIMAKEVDVIEQATPIETITIDDDDSEDEREAEKQRREQQQKQLQQQQKEKQQQQQQRRTPDQQITPTSSTQTSRKNSTASRSSSITSNSSSDVEMIIVPCTKPEDAQAQPKQQAEMKQPANGAIINIVKAESLAVSKEDFEKSLRCDEMLEKSLASSAWTNYLTKSGSVTLTPIERLQNKTGEESFIDLEACRRRVQQTFSMLRWRDKQQLPNSKMRFELNRYGLLQLAERCETRKTPASYFEKPLHDRRARRPLTSTEPLLYLCSRCNFHGPASDFLAPKFCSISCVRRSHKRRLLNQSSTGSENKISRMRDIKVSNGHMKQLPRDKDRQREQKVDTSKPPFRWTEYLKMISNGEAAPIHLFLNPFPITPNCFERGMKLEAIDPENCSLFCVCTIVEVRGYRLKLNFDGYSNMYDFWVNADSMDIFPPGWCERTSRVLQAPKGYSAECFNWQRYLVKTNAKAAPTALFTHLNTPKHVQINYFAIGMHLEAEDLNDTGKICVATIADILDERIRVHFDGWDDCYDFWVHINSPYIHPCGWHEGRQQLIVPPDYQNIAFSWPNYIKQVGGIAAPVELFKPREPMEYQAGMRLEVVDQRNPCLIRPATVLTRKGYRIQLHLDCWRPEYFFWLEDDSPDLHPIGWCEATSHELEVPPGFEQNPSLMPCDMPGCRGFGNAKCFNLNVHALRDCCPYAPDNWRQWRAKTVKPPRVLPEHIKRAESPKPEAQPQPQPESTPILYEQLNSHAKTLASSKTKTYMQSARLRRSLDGEPKAKLKREERSSLEVQNRESVSTANVTGTVELNQRCMSIAKTIVAEYGPQFSRNYRLWQKNSEFDMGQLKSNPLYWTNWDVYEFVERALKSTRIAQLLFDEDVDGRALLMMGRQDLVKHFKLKLGPTVKLFSLIVNLRIAVACKFQTKETGLNINHAWVMHEIGPKKRELSQAKTETEEANSSSDSVENQSEEEEEDCDEEEDEDAEADDDDNDDDFDYKEESDQEPTDDEDVVLDNEDFLSVKPLRSFSKNVATHQPKESDVIRTSVDAIPMTLS